jgi:glutathione peroxidase
MTTAIESIPLKTITHEDSSLGAYAGKVRLVVNVASKCGLTPQYEGLEELYRQYQDKGLVVLGFPANDFAGQEPGTNAEIAEFCRTTFSVDFPMFAKIPVTGDHKHPLYAELVKQHPGSTGDGDAFRGMLSGHGITPTQAPEVLWNFEKFLIDRDGKVAARFVPGTAPNDPALVAKIEELL